MFPCRVQNPHNWLLASDCDDNMVKVESYSRVWIREFVGKPQRPLPPLASGRVGTPISHEVGELLNGPGFKRYRRKTLAVSITFAWAQESGEATIRSRA